MGEAFGSRFCMAAAHLALRDPRRLQAKPPPGISIAEFKRAIEDMPRYLAWVAALGYVDQATWTPAVAGELARRLGWWHLTPHPNAAQGDSSGCSNDSWSLRTASPGWQTSGLARERPGSRRLIPSPRARGTSTSRPRHSVRACSRTGRPTTLTTRAPGTPARDPLQGLKGHSHEQCRIAPGYRKRSTGPRAHGPSSTAIQGSQRDCR